MNVLNKKDIDTNINHVNINLTTDRNCKNRNHKNGSDRNGRDGRDGIHGSPGDRGNIGAKGNIGEKGCDGRNGTNGTPGDIGDKGSKGNEGEHGCDGRDGVGGRDGYDGKYGINGDNGDKGDKGNNGDEGEPGRDGRDGKRGCDGVKGDIGKIGAIGATGVDGTNGDDGTNGGTESYYGVTGATVVSISVESGASRCLSPLTSDPGAGLYLATFNGNYDTTSQTYTSQDIYDDVLIAKQFLIDIPDLTSRTASSTPTSPFLPGVYTGGDLTIPANAVFDGGGDPNAIFFFNRTGVITTCAGIWTTTGMASPSNIFIVGDSWSPVSDIYVLGTFILSGTVILPDIFELNGRIATDSNITLNLSTAGRLTYPITTSSVPLGRFENTIFITNTGDIIDNNSSRLVHIYGNAASVDGNYKAVAGNSSIYYDTIGTGGLTDNYDDLFLLSKTQFEIGYYIGTTLVPRSLRMVYSETPILSETMTIHAYIDYPGSGSITIKITSIFGTFDLTDYFFSIIKV
jgi:hypothetical protein